MKSFQVLDKRNGNILITVNCYEKKVYKMMLQQFKKVRGINVKELDKNE